MADDRTAPAPGYLHPRALYWRSVAALALFLAVCSALSAALAYLIVSPELAKDYFSAHRTVKAAWRLVVPALAVSAAAGFLLAAVGTALGLRRHSRRVLLPLRELDALVRALGAGKLPPPVAGDDVQAHAAAALEPLRAREQELQRLAREIQKVSLELNYRSAGTAEVTRKDLRALSARLEELTRDLSRSSGWLQG